MSTSAEQLYNDILDGFNSSSLNTLFRKAAIYAEKVNDNKLREWCSLELTGYPENKKLPTYRIIPVIIYDSEGEVIDMHYGERPKYYTMVESSHREKFSLRGPIKT
jgi:hypothetical protein